MQPPPPFTLSIRELARRRIMEDMVKAAQPPGRWRIMVIDSASLKILNAVCKMYDILEQNITLVENIERKRTSNLEYEAIYFISPTNESVTGLINDFTNARPMYAAAHVFFTGGLSDRLFEKIKRSGITTYLRKLVELNVDFLALESQVFSLDLPYSLRVLYNSFDTSITQQHLSIISKKLASVCATLGEYPHLRFWDPRNERRNVSYRLASMVQDELDNLCRLDASFPPKTTFARSTLIILDRGFDITSPILHEFTYQSMANDLLPTEGANRFVYGRASSDSSSTENTATLEESDPLWVKYRHTHIAEVINGVITDFQKFLEENPAAKGAAGQLKSSGGDTLSSLKQMKDMIYAMPGFQEGKSKYSIHINLCNECMAYYTRFRLEKLAGVEQDMVMGETGDGKSVKNIEVDMVPILSDPEVSVNDKLRILIGYILSKDGIADTDRSKLLGCANLPLDASQAITNLHLLGARLSAGSDRKRDGKPRYNYEGVVAWEKSKKKRQHEEEYVLSRWKPIVRYVIEDCLNNKLDKALFPYTKDPPPDSNSSSSSSASKAAPTSAPVGGSGQITSLRTTKPSWAKRVAGDRSGITGSSSTDATIKSSDPIDLRKNGPRVMLFILGGVTFSELKCCYDLLREYSRDVVIGSTHTLTPNEFLDELKEIHKSPVDGKGGLRDARWGGALGHNDGLITPRSSSAVTGMESDHSQRRGEKKGGLFGFGKK